MHEGTDKPEISNQQSAALEMAENVARSDFGFVGLVEMLFSDFRFGSCAYRSHQSDRKPD